MTEKQSAKQPIFDEATKRGITVDCVNIGKLYQFTLGNHVEYLYNFFTSNTSAEALLSTNNKKITKMLLEKSGLSTPKGDLFQRNQFKSLLKYAKTLKWPLILKPVSGRKGDCVYINITTESELKEAFDAIAVKYEEVLLEEMFFGTEYRIFASRNKVMAVANRTPANIIGDGIHTIKALIDCKNSEIGRLVKIKIDEIVSNNLKKKNLSLDSILKMDEQIFLRENSNISTGGDVIDVTDDIHPSVGEIAVRAINAIPGLAYGGVDFMTTDVTKKQTADSYTILEINASASIKMHQCPTLGQSRNVAGGIVDIMFPENVAIKKDKK